MPPLGQKMARAASPLPQAQRLWGLPPDVCAQVVYVLVGRAVLKRSGRTLSMQD